MNFTWRKWFESLVVNVVYSSLLTLSVVVTDGAVTPEEWKLIGLAALGGFFMYLRSHHPPMITDEMLISQQGTVGAEVVKLATMESKQDAKVAAAKLLR